MQSYFRLSASSRLRCPLSIFGLPEQYQKAAENDVFDHLDQAIVAYFRAEACEEIPAILNVPSFFVSDELKRLFTLYLPGLQVKMIQLFAGELDSREFPLWGRFNTCGGEVTMSESNHIQPDNRFVYRLMSAKCSYGSMSHPLNVAESGGGHGVLFGPEAQPVLNANDWRPDVNVIHFGDCTPREQNIETGEAVEKKGFEKFWSGVVEFSTAQKCAPIIDQVWYETDDRYLIDDAPVLLMKGILFCKRGGIITIEVTEPESGSEEGTEKTQEQVQADMEQANAEVAASVDQALAEGSCGSMKLSDSSGGSVALGDVAASALAESQKLAQESEGADRQAVPIVMDMLGHLT